MEATVYDAGWWERVEVIKRTWRAEIAAKQEDLWVNPVRLKCPVCGAGCEWPEDWKRPNCGSCYLYRGDEVQLQKVREPVPEQPKRRSTAEELADMRTEIARLADALKPQPEEER
jgi:hypothetical protein